MPTPIVVPMTMQVESSKPSCRLSSVCFVEDGSGKVELVLYKSDCTEVSIWASKAGAY